MKYFSIICLCLFGGNVWAMSCAVPLSDGVLHTGAIYPNSVFWISLVYGDNIQDKFVTLNSKNDKDNKMLLEYISDQKLIKLTPKNKLKNENYELKSSVIPNYVGGGTYLVEVNTPVHIEKPQLISIKNNKNYSLLYGNTQQSTSILFNLKTNLDSKQYLINVKSYKNQNSEDFESYVARPFSSKNGVESFELWSDFNSGCPSVRKTQNFSFQEGKTVYLKFDLITYDGKIIPWQGDAEVYKFNIKK
ncbi:hypothetical protein [Acinetobacter gerneri]|uniref:hypothetical protein n=1 Tax=Acinetobacter gerneri TaxID=202952 RepID=UPI0032142B78